MSLLSALEGVKKSPIAGGRTRFFQTFPRVGVWLANDLPAPC